MNKKDCCIIGYTHIPDNKVDFVTARLQDEIADAISQGYTTFISAFDEEADLLFAEIVIEHMAQQPHLFWASSNCVP